MKALRWIIYTAFRYVSRGRRNSPSLVFSVLGIATGVLALIVIIAVMNGFQIGFIESILEISSCHLRLEGFTGGKIEHADLRNSIVSLPEVRSVIPFEELNVLLRSGDANTGGALVRGVPENALDIDRGLAEKLEMERGFFDLNEPYNIVLGAELAGRLNAHLGSEVNLLSISGGLGNGTNHPFKVSGIFRSGFYEYDLGWAFINIETAAELLGDKAAPVFGIKLKNRWQDQRAIAEIKKLAAGSGIHNPAELSVTSWRDYNRSFFSALRTEKLIMFTLVGLIFIVVGLNIFQAQRRIVLERREEIGILRALGASDTAVRMVFAWDGFIVGLAGAVGGLVPGLVIASNISPFFSLLESAVNFFISVVNSFSGFLGGNADAGKFAVFSPQVFYIKEIPSKLIFHEVLLIFLFGFLAALLASWFASGKVSGTKPAEVLRYE